ncbi:hypothetical protein EB093_08275 [bacterium]|nr:hypothetical protein [bacterium]
MRPGLGLANKAGAAIELLNASGATKILLSMGADALINAGVSGGSQYAKDGSVDLGRVVIDTFAGVVGSIASREVMSTSQGSQTASKLYREAGELSQLRSIKSPLLQNQIQTAQEAIIKAKSYGAGRAAAVGTAVSNAITGLYELGKKSYDKEQKN